MPKVMAENCHWCGKYIYRGSGEHNYQLGNRFCNDECRNHYHNAKKKVARQEKTILEALEVIAAFKGKDGELGDMAENLIRLIANNTAHRVKKVLCKDCGQGRFTIPAQGEKCSFCKGENWSIK